MDESLKIICSWCGINDAQDDWMYKAKICKPDQAVCQQCKSEMSKNIQDNILKWTEEWITKKNTPQ